MAPVQIRVLILEDRPEDAELILNELSTAGLEFDWQRVETEAEYLSSLETAPDIILADYTLPQFDALRALELLRERGLDIPLFIVSGAIGEDTAVAGMRAGACDYVTKSNLARLSLAVQREIREAHGRRKRREADAAVLSSGRKWQTTFDAIGDGVCILDQTGMILESNKAVAELLGGPEAENPTRACLRANPEHCGCSFHAAARSLQRETEVVQLGARWFGIRVDPITNGQGVFEGAVQITSDITERKMSEQALQENEEKFREITGAIQDAVILVDNSGRVTYWSPAAEKLFGYSLDEALGSPMVDLVIPEQSRDIMSGALRAFLEHVSDGDRRSPAIERPGKRKDGTVFPSELSFSKVRLRGEWNGLAVVRDITERKHAEDALQLRAQLLDAASDSIFLYHLDGTIVYANEASHQMHGCPGGELIGKNMRSILSPRYAERFESRFARIMQGAEPCFESVHVCVDGSEVPVEVHVRVIDVNGVKMGLSVSRDITDRKRIEDELRQALAQTRAGFEGIVHGMASLLEIRDPYTAGHQRRVARLAISMAREMGFTEERIEGVRVAGLVHDIGKISVPAEILSKPGRLSESEFSLIKSHALVGYDILKPIEFPWPVAQIVLQTHERMDGSGYPSGLRGEEILLEARILAVCDVVEAMASHRPYRPALGVEDALEEISRGSGVVYDPAVADACLKVFAGGAYNLDDGEAG